MREAKFLHVTPATAAVEALQNLGPDLSWDNCGKFERNVYHKFSVFEGF